ncbi:guanosine-5'-triphosphate,3'-diphosphate pyrophosphatase [bacterium BMS3Abin10]|nr:guanosine-5'-triphosphate,3'-diphosphate pyrophosphatase [bacterium BMS3Abin10]GBE38163.1 guanosine-5'-triphosphate,3'-diphosphate pyrophosphatase [bacterium BMS3Bbin08]
MAEFAELNGREQKWLSLSYNFSVNSKPSRTGSKRLAAIDIGTNTFRLLIAEVRPDNRGKNFSIREIHSERIITRLGEGITEKGLIKKQAIDRSIAALKNFSNIISHHNVRRTSALATSALRDAGNKGAFLKKALDTAGLKVEIVSGEEEARITSSGMLIGIDLPETALMVDIGGGSTELILSRHGRSQSVYSLHLGVVYLAEKYMKKDPPAGKDLALMGREISERIAPTVKPLKKLFSSDTVFIGTAGTVTALAAMKQNLKSYDHNKIHNSGLTAKEIKQIYSDISAIGARERAKYHSLEPGRLDIIVPGTLILLKLVATFGFKQVIVSDYGLREGILLDLYRKIKNEK